MRAVTSRRAARPAPEREPAEPLVGRDAVAVGYTYWATCQGSCVNRGRRGCATPGSAQCQSPSRSSRCLAESTWSTAPTRSTGSKCSTSPRSQSRRHRRRAPRSGRGSSVLASVGLDHLLSSSSTDDPPRESEHRRRRIRVSYEPGIRRNRHLQRFCPSARPDGYLRWPPERCHPLTAGTCPSRATSQRPTAARS